MMRAGPYIRQRHDFERQCAAGWRKQAEHLEKQAAELRAAAEVADHEADKWAAGTDIATVAHGEQASSAPQQNK
jgi:hypothetical protein